MSRTAGWVVYETYGGIWPMRLIYVLFVCRYKLTLSFLVNYLHAILRMSGYICVTGCVLT